MLNEHLLGSCRKRMSDRLRGHAETIGERLQRDLAALQKPLPPPYDACEKVPATVSSLSLVRYRRNDYSVPTSFGHREVIVRGIVPDELERFGVGAGDEFDLGVRGDRIGEVGDPAVEAHGHGALSE